jgi:hypothetical protein
MDLLSTWPPAMLSLAVIFSASLVSGLTTGLNTQYTACCLSAGCSCFAFVAKALSNHVILVATLLGSVIFIASFLGILKGSFYISFSTGFSTDLASVLTARLTYYCTHLAPVTPTPGKQVLTSGLAALAIVALALFQQVPNLGRQVDALSGCTLFAIVALALL